MKKLIRSFSAFFENGQAFHTNLESDDTLEDALNTPRIRVRKKELREVILINREKVCYTRLIEKEVEVPDPNEIRTPKEPPRPDIDLI